MAALLKLPRPLLAVSATLFAAASILYSCLWIFSASRPIPVELGFDNQYLPKAHAELVKGVTHDSPAERAGMKPGDRIVEVNGTSVEENTLVRIWSQHKPGDTVDLSIERPGVASPILLRGTFRAAGHGSTEGGVAQHLGRDINSLYPVVFITVGLTVLFFRLEDTNAWLMALMFAGFIAIPGFANSFFAVPSALRPFAIVYRSILNNTVTAFFYFFFATFPVRSVLDRRLPWLKWLALAIGAVLALPRLVSANGIPALGLGPGGYGHLSILIFNYSLIVLGLISLASNAISATSSEARRKIRVILWGTLVGVIPATLALGASDFFGFNITLWMGATIVLLLWLFPLSFAYAVVKHRVLEVPVLLRRSARYLLVQRGFVFLLVVISVAITTVFALFFARYLQSITAAAVPGGIALGTIFGTILFWTGSRVRKDVGERIDRAFFRSAYDARIILEDLVEKTRTATDRMELAALLERHLKQALQPSFVAVYFESHDSQLSLIAGEVPPESKTISAANPALCQLARNGQPREVLRESGNETPYPTSLSLLRPDCLVPILGRDNRLAGLIVLGPRLSEEPYSGDDKHLLTAAVGQAGVALESISLGEKIAERIEAERRVAQEMEFARQVQSRLFPQKLPSMKTLEYAGGCSPARTVGGDYYDFLELRAGRLGVVLADIAGKGVAGALLMANLQANLRSQYAMAVEDLPRLLESVNRLFYQSTDDSSYATLFFADYDDTTRLLRYVNCGHLPALVLRGGQSRQHDQSKAGSSNIEWLRSTCTVLGLFENWQCKIAEVKLAPGDAFVLYTDGITEAMNGTGDEFGERRLLETLKNHVHLPVAELMDCVVSAVRQFSVSEQQDDITLVVARCQS